MKGTQSLLPISKPIYSAKYLAVALRNLSDHPFKPPEHTDIKVLSPKVALLLDLGTAKRV